MALAIGPAKAAGQPGYLAGCGNDLEGPLKRITEHQPQVRVVVNYQHPRATAFPPVNLWSSPEGVAVTAELPGLDPSNLEISATADTVAQQRFEVAYNRYVIGNITIDNLYIAQQEKDQARTQYVRALRAYWESYYRLRRVTLYDFEANRAIR